MFKRVALVLLLCCTLSGAFLTPAAAQTPRPVIIDTDMTTDDFMATLLTLKDPNFEVKAITVTGTGWAFCDAGVQAALGIVALADAGDIPVSCWRDDPLVGENPVPADWRTNLEAVAALGLPEGGQPVDEDAVALFTSTVQDSPEKVTVLAIGPLTNIAQAFEDTPSLIDNIEMIYVMGGAVDVPGSEVSDENTTAEWNIYCDPVAARMVFESGAPITLVPLDATNDVPLSMDFLNQLEADKHTPEAEFVYTALSNSTDFIESGGYYFWDPLAAGIMADPSLATMTERDVTVIDVPGPDFGRTKPVGNGPRIEVATAPDGAAFLDYFMGTLNP
ncbi:MAG TPA: nucleoside hydrolase [Aggregatilinea sp.]|jgi:pyrimidine-specific ribonucleoside hydrolase|uniref:nucleoside hydrolase n=1 Tax=Aggregatilinea sp. TaxID=2806333 RepID=UPI002BB967D2|nr:nucleoside hydrolase [Aggregatilinea sp.]HML23108.1 nucleoside hydrolase [Aggregatilinea sp.]